MMTELSPGRLVPGVLHGADGEARRGLIDGIHCRFVDGSDLGLPSDWWDARTFGDDTIVLWKTDGNVEFYRLKGGRFVRTSRIAGASEIYTAFGAIRWDKDSLPVAFETKGTCSSSIAKWYDMDGNELGISPMFVHAGEPTLLCESFPLLPTEVNGVAFGGIGSIWSYSGPSEDCVCWMRALEVRALLAEDWGPQEKPITVESVNARAGDVVLEVAVLGGGDKEQHRFGRRKLRRLGYTVVSGFAKNRLYTITRAFLDDVVAARQLPKTTSINYLGHFGTHWWVLGESTREVQWALGGFCRDGKAYAQKFCRIHFEFTIIAYPSEYFAFGGRALLVSPAEGAPRVSHLLPGSLEQLEVEAIEAALAGLAELAELAELTEDPSDDGDPAVREPLPLRVLRCFIREDAEVILWQALQSADF